MKSYLYASIVIGALLTNPAAAATKCVALGSSTTCTTNSSTGNGADWSATCNTNGTSVPVRGIAFCSNQSASGSGQSTITVSNDASKNTVCYCRVISPVVSQWVAADAYSSGATCLTRCQLYCGSQLQNTASFRNSLLSNFSD